MNNIKLTTLSLVTATVIGLTGCGGSSGGSTPSTPSTSAEWPVVTNQGCGTDASKYTTPTSSTLPATIDTCTKLTKAGSPWKLAGKTAVRNGADLWLEPGTVVEGENPASFLAITAGSKIHAVGTKAEPIVFTSNKDVNPMGLDNNHSDDGAQGEWGGLILAGQAYTHYSKNKYEADETITFGRTDHKYDTESSGELDYVSVKHSGYRVAKDKELNGLSLAGVGSGTKISNIAIIGGADDAIEIWGGRPNLTNIYLYNGSDDSVDTDLGYRGTWKNVLVDQEKLDSYNDHDSAACETGNDGDTISTDDSNATQTHIVNMTAHIRGGGISMKYDAGMIFDNVQFISDRNLSVGPAQVVYRGPDVVKTHAMHVDGQICFKDNNLTLNDDLTFSKKNTKIASTTENAFTDWVTNVGTATGVQLGASGSINVDSTACTGVDETAIWKGKAGSNDPVETYVYK
jgi:hypothetical protein